MHKASAPSKPVSLDCLPISRGGGERGWLAQSQHLVILNETSCQCTIARLGIALLGIALLGIALLGIAPDTLVLWGTKCCLTQYLLTFYLQVVGGITGIRGSLYYVNALRLQSKLVLFYLSYGGNKDQIKKKSMIRKQWSCINCNQMSQLTFSFVLNWGFK